MFVGGRGGLALCCLGAPGSLRAISLPFHQPLFLLHGLELWPPLACPVLIAFCYIQPLTWPFQLHFTPVRLCREAKETSPASLGQTRFTQPLFCSQCSIKRATLFYLLGFLLREPATEVESGSEMWQTHKSPGRPFKLFYQPWREGAWPLPLTSHPALPGCSQVGLSHRLFPGEGKS